MTLLSVVKEATDIYTTYGITGLIVLIALTIGYFALKKVFEKSKNSTTSAIENGFTKMSESLSETIKEQNDKILDAFIIQSNKNNETMHEVLMKALSDKSANDTIAHAQSINRRIKISSKVQQKVNNLFYSFNCDRAFILEFHNNKQNLTGLSFVWYDMVYEAVAKGFYTLQNSYKDQEISQLIPVIDAVNDGGGYAHFLLEDLENLKYESTALYNRLRVERQLSEALLVGLYDSTNSMIGLLVLEYEDGFLPVEKAVDYDDLLSEANAIATLLDCTNMNDEC
jgi:hypothetical protein